MKPFASRLTRAQLRVIDRRAVADFQMPSILLMENAARSAVEVAAQMVAPGASIQIVCGGGNNGGDGLAIARLLHNRGYDVAVRLAIDPAKYAGDALINWRIVRAMNLQLGRVKRPALIVDAIFGTGLEKPPRDDAAKLIDELNGSGTPILAIDLPSGLDCDTGVPLGACIRATRTISFVAAKAGFSNPESEKFTGEVVVGEIGAPLRLIEDVAGQTR